MLSPQEQPVEVLTSSRKITIGLPAASSALERRFPMTPEGAAMLCSRGFEVKMEEGAAAAIHFSDDAYRRQGVAIVSRNEALGCDIVVHLPAISMADAVHLKKGAVLLSLLHTAHQSAKAVNVLLQRNIVSIALDLIEDARGNKPFADILSEVDGRAAMALASSLLADSVYGKGILLGGIAGVVPCEVTIIGSGIAARAAARSALGLGATVRMFDNDVYRLREALHEIGEQSVIGSSVHPRVFASAIRSADIIIATETRLPYEVSMAAVDEMKRGVIAFDLTYQGVRCAFPGLECIDLAIASASDCSPAMKVRACYVHAGSAVPRTAAMALSTTLMTTFDEIIANDGVTNSLRFNKGLSCAVYTFMGKPVHPDIAALLGQRTIDISLFLQFL